MKIILIVFAVIVALVLIFVGVLTVTEYRPEDVETLEVRGGSGQTSGNPNTSADNEASSEDNNGTNEIHQGDSLTVLTWNTGYGALGDNADFFMDGGEMVKTADKDRVLANVAGITDTIKDIDPDIIMLQEVDENSTRSYGINERESYEEAFAGYYTSFAYNYKTLMVPYPLPPIGKVASGIMTLSAYSVDSAVRIKLPCPFSYPVRLCNLKRCLLVSRIPVAGSDKELVIVNVHLEAYDSGEGKEAQTKMLAELLKKEQEAGNYVIAGGDFNQAFSNVDISDYPLQRDDLWAPGLIDTEAFGEHLSCLTDPANPTCRSLDLPLDTYEGSDFQYYVIDGFIVSDNVTVESLETLNEGFKNTDHNPLKLVVKLD